MKDAIVPILRLFVHRNALSCIFLSYLFEAESSTVTQNRIVTEVVALLGHGKASDGRPEGPT